MNAMPDERLNDLRKEVMTMFGDLPKTTRGLTSPEQLWLSRGYSSRNRTNHPTKHRRYNWRKHDQRMAQFYKEALWG